MPVSHRHRALFVHIPKCGGSSVERAFGMHGDHRVEDRERLFGRVASADLREIAGATNYLQHLDLVQMRRALAQRADGLLSFTFVRNPFDRLVSAWAGADGDLHACARAQGIELRGLDFPRFVDATIRLDHPHVAPQLGFIVDGQGERAVDFVGYFERLGDDFARLCDRLGLAPGERPALPHAHRSRHAHYRELYDTRARVLVSRRYRADLEAFGYEY
jgi:hypothetical protein